MTGGEQERGGEREKSWNKAVRASSEAKERLCGRVSYFASLAASAGGRVCVCMRVGGWRESEHIKGKGEQGQVTFTQQVETTQILLKIELNLHTSTRDDQKFTSSAPFAINANVQLI